MDQAGIAVARRKSILMNTRALSYDTSHNRITDPGEYGPLFDALSTDLTALHAALNSVLIHIYHVERQYPHLLESRPYEVFIRHTRSLLEGI